MYKDLLIIGPSRSGKTTLARQISDKYDCNTINLDNLIESYMKTFEASEENENYLKQFMVNYFSKLTEYRNFYYDKKLVIEGNLQFVEEIVNSMDPDKLAIIGLTYNNIDIDYFMQKIKEAEYADYLQYLSESSLRSRLNEFVDESKKLGEKFKQFEIINYDVSGEREELFNNIVDEVEEITKYGSSYKIKKLK